MQVLSPFQIVCLRHLLKHSRHPVPEAAPRIPPLLFSQVYATQTASECQSPLLLHSQREEPGCGKSHVGSPPPQCFRNLFLYISRKTHTPNKNLIPGRPSFLRIQQLNQYQCRLVYPVPSPVPPLWKVRYMVIVLVCLGLAQF